MPERVDESLKALGDHCSPRKLLPLEEEARETALRSARKRSKAKINQPVSGERKPTLLCPLNWKRLAIGVRVPLKPSACCCIRGSRYVFKFTARN